MSQSPVKGKTASLIGVIIGVLTIPLAAAAFFIAYKGAFERAFVLVAGGLALFSIIGLFVSYKGASRMKKSGANDLLGKIGIIFSSLSLIAALAIAGISATTETKQNELFNEKEFDKEKAGMDSLLNMLDQSGDTTHNDSINK